MFDIYLARTEHSGRPGKVQPLFGLQGSGTLLSIQPAGQTIVQYMVSPSLSISLFSLSLPLYLSLFSLWLLPIMFVDRNSLTDVMVTDKWIIICVYPSADRASIGHGKVRQLSCLVPRGE